MGFKNIQHSGTENASQWQSACLLCLSPGFNFSALQITHSTFSVNNSLNKIIYYISFLLCVLCMCVAAFSIHTYGGQRTDWEIQFSFYHAVLGKEPRLSVLVASAFTYWATPSSLLILLCLFSLCIKYFCKYAET